jgi:hypothetical protein
VCVECKRQQTVCVAVAQGIPCLGPVTQAGCGAICPSCNRGCYTCYGPKETPNLVSLHGFYQDRGHDAGHLLRLTRNFNGYAPPFREASDALEQADDR